MIKRAASLAGVLATVALVGCASGGGSGGDTFSMSLGMGSPADVDRHTTRILNRYGYQIERVQQSANDVYIESRWQVRDLFEEEVAGGYEAARTKLHITGRPRGPNLNLHLMVENQGREVGGSWETMPSTAEFREYAREIGQELRSEYSTGIRVY